LTVGIPDGSDIKLWVADGIKLLSSFDRSVGAPGSFIDAVWLCDGKFDTLSTRCLFDSSNVCSVMLPLLSVASKFDKFIISIELICLLETVIEVRLDVMVKTLHKYWPIFIFNITVELFLNTRKK